VKERERERKSRYFVDRSSDHRNRPANSIRNAARRCASTPFTGLDRVRSGGCRRSFCEGGLGAVPQRGAGGRPPDGSPARNTHTHTHTHPFNGPFSGTTRVSWYQKGKTNLDFIEARDSEWQWHQLGHMQVCTLLQTDNHTSISPLCFLQAGCPSCRPTNSVKALKALGVPPETGVLTHSV